MSRLAERLITRIRNKEEQAIETEAQRKAAELENQVRAVSDEVILQERAKQLGGMMVSMHLSKKSKPRRLKSSSRLIERKLVVHKNKYSLPGMKRHNLYEELYSPLIQVQEEYIDGHTVVSGFRARLSRYHHLNDHFYISENENWKNHFFRKGLYIDRVYRQKVNPSMEESEPIYRIGLINPGIDSFTDGEPDNNLVAIQKQAGLHALALTGQIVELLERR